MNTEGARILHDLLTSSPASTKLDPDLSSGKPLRNMSRTVQIYSAPYTPYIIQDGNVRLFTIQKCRRQSANLPAASSLTALIGDLRPGAKRRAQIFT